MWFFVANRMSAFKKRHSTVAVAICMLLLKKTYIAHCGLWVRIPFSLKTE